MFGIKHKGRYQVSRLHGWIYSIMKPVAEKISIRLRLKARIALLNRWGRRHPMRFTIYYCFFAIVLLFLNILSSIAFCRFSESQSDPLNLTEISASDPLDGMNTVNRNRETIRAMLNEYADTNRKLTHRLDSLINLPVKTAQDSTDIRELYEKLINNPLITHP